MSRPRGLLDKLADTILREPRPRKLKGKEKSWQEESGELEEQWWCGVRGEERGGVKSGGSSTFFQKSSSCYSYFESPSSNFTFPIFHE